MALLHRGNEQPKTIRLDESVKLEKADSRTLKRARRVYDNFFIEDRIERRALRMANKTRIAYLTGNEESRKALEDLFRKPNYSNLRRDLSIFVNSFEVYKDYFNKVWGINLDNARAGKIALRGFLLAAGCGIISLYNITVIDYISHIQRSVGFRFDDLFRDVGVWLGVNVTDTSIIDFSAKVGFELGFYVTSFAGILALRAFNRRKKLDKNFGKTLEALKGIQSNS